MEKKEKQLLTIIKTTEIGIVNFNGGKVKGQRHAVETAEGLHGQIWIRSARSLEKNYPLNEARYYDLIPLEYLGEPTWKVVACRADDLTDQDKAHRRKAITTNAPHVPLMSNAREPRSADKNMQDSILSAAAVIGAAILVAGGKEDIDDILPRALLLKKDMEYMVHERSKETKVSRPSKQVEEVTEDDIAPF